MQQPVGAVLDRVQFEVGHVRRQPIKQAWQQGQMLLPGVDHPLPKVLARDHVPGWVVAQIMFTDPAFPISRIIARRVPHVPAPAASLAVEDLLS
mgnify:CR=1 FL=1